MARRTTTRKRGGVKADAGTGALVTFVNRVKDTLDSYFNDETDPPEPEDALEAIANEYADLAERDGRFPLPEWKEETDGDDDEDDDENPDGL